MPNEVEFIDENDELIISGIQVEAREIY